MSIPVLVAIPDREVEHRIVTAFGRPGSGLSIVRRCVDLPDVIGASAGCLASAVIVAPELRGLDRDAVARLQTAGLAVVVIGGTANAGGVVRDVGADEVLDAAADPAAVAAAVGRVVAMRRAPKSTRRQQVRATTPAAPAEPPPASGGQGRIVAIWGPAGAPGRTLLATTMAAEFAVAGSPTLLVDADVYAASVAQLVAVLDEIPGLAAACRLANAGDLDLASLAEQTRMVTVRRQHGIAPLRVLTGLPRAARWPEIRPLALQRVLALARSLADVTVVDCSSCLEQDEELSYDIDVPRRNGATIAALRAADDIVAIGRADPIGVARLVRGLDELSDIVGAREVRVVLNRLRKGPIPGDPGGESARALRRFGSIEVSRYLPEDRSGVDKAVATGSFVVEVAPGSPYRQAVRSLVADLLGRDAPAPARGLIRRVRGARA